MKPYEPTNDAKIHKHEIDDNDMIDRKYNKFAASISNDPKFYGHNYNFTPPACGTKPRADTSNIVTTSTTLPFNVLKKPSFFNNRHDAYSYASNIDLTQTPLKNDKNLKQEFDWERANQSQHRSHSHAESDDHLLDKFALDSPSSSSSDDDKFDSESDGDDHPLARHPRIDDDSWCDESDEHFKRHNDMMVKSAPIDAANANNSLFSCTMKNKFLHDNNCEPPTLKNKMNTLLSSKPTIDIKSTRIIRDILKEDASKNNVKEKVKSKQFRCKGSTCAKHHVNANGDVVCYCKFKKRKGNNCTCRITVSPNGDVAEIGEHGVECVADDNTNNSNIPDHTNDMMGMVDELEIKNLSWTPRQVWWEIKNMLDVKSNASWIGKNDSEVINRVKHMRHVMVGKDAFCMIEQPHVGKIKDSAS